MTDQSTSFNLPKEVNIMIFSEFVRLTPGKKVYFDKINQTGTVLSYEKFFRNSITTPRADLDISCDVPVMIVDHDGVDTYWIIDHEYLEIIE
jgi:hypothetical protein